MAEVKRKWYVVRAVTGKERKVKEQLEAEIDRHGIKDYVAQILIPTEKVYQIRNGKKVSKVSCCPAHSRAFVAQVAQRQRGDPSGDRRLLRGAALL